MLGNINPFAKKKDDSTTELSTQTPDTEVVAQTKETTPEAPEKKKGFVGGLKDKAVEKMLEKQLAQVPPQQREMLMKAIKENPDFFEMIAKKIKEEEKKNGGNQMAAAMKVMREHQGEMMRIMGGAK